MFFFFLKHFLGRGVELAKELQDGDDEHIVHAYVIVCSEPEFPPAFRSLPVLGDGLLPSRFLGFRPNEDTKVLGRESPG